MRGSVLALLLLRAAGAAGAAVRSWRLPSFGAIDNLRLAGGDRAALPEDGGWVRVQVRAIGLNYADIFSCLGLYKAANLAAAAQDDDFCPGLEFSGVVLEAGAGGAGGLSAGDRVFGFTRFGAYQSEVVQREALLRRMPDGWTFEQGASILVQGLTAYHGLVSLGGAARGKRALIHSAAGGVGLNCLQICEALGVRAVGVVGNEGKADFLRERFPGQEVLVRGAGAAYAEQLERLEEPNFDIVMDSLGGRYFSAAFERLRPMGRIVHFGATAPSGAAEGGLRKWLRLVPAFLGRPRVDPAKLTSSNRGVLGFNLIFLTEREEMLAQQLDAMLDEGGLAARPPAVGRVFPFEELPAALRYLQSGASVGKVVVSLAEPGGGGGLSVNGE